MRNAAIATRLAKLEAPPKHLLAGQRQGCLLVPPILSLDAWEADAMASQRQLVLDTHEGLDAGPSITDTTRRD